MDTEIITDIDDDADSTIHRVRQFFSDTICSQLQNPTSRGIERQTLDHLSCCPAECRLIDQSFHSSSTSTYATDCIDISISLKIQIHQLWFK